MELTSSRLTPVAAIIAAIMGILIFDDVIAASLGEWHLTAGQVAWRFAPLAAGGIALSVIATRIRASK